MTDAVIERKNDDDDPGGDGRRTEALWMRLEDHIVSSSADESGQAGLTTKTTSRKETETYLDRGKRSFPPVLLPKVIRSRETIQEGSGERDSFRPAGERAGALLCLREGQALRRLRGDQHGGERQRMKTWAWWWTATSRTSGNAGNKVTKLDAGHQHLPGCDPERLHGCGSHRGGNRQESP